MSVNVPNAGEIMARFEERRGKPMRAMIEIADRCNEVCVHCYQVQGKKGEMDTAQVKQVIDELADMGILLLTISGGEATLRPDLLELIAHARTRGFLITLFTNGMTMTDALAKSLADLAVFKVEISVYSNRAHIHDFVTGVPGSWEKTVAGIRALVKYGVLVVGKSPVMAMNEDHFEEHLQFLRDLGAEVRGDPSPLGPREGYDNSPAQWDASEQAAVRLRSSDIVRHLKGQPGYAPEDPNKLRPSNREKLQKPVCGAGHSLVVDPDGAIRPCTMLDVDMGHAVTDGIAKSRAEHAEAQFLRTLTWQNLHGCRDCDLRTYCGRCYATSLSETGDAAGPYASACKKALIGYQTRTGNAAIVTASTIAGRESTMGPFREVSDGVFELVADVITADDIALANAHPWLRRVIGLKPAMLPAVPGELVQIRRPGQKQLRYERLPMSHEAPPSDNGQGT